MTEHALTKQDVRALAHADSLCFDHTGVDTGQIRAILRAEKSPTGFEQTHSIPATSSIVNNYGTEDGDWRGFHMILSAQYDEIGHTLVRHLREGSRFALVWTRDNASPITRDAGVVRDELRIRVQGKNSKVADTFLVAVFIGKDNSARMVTHHRPALDRF
jgi:hypothetical protein